MVLQPRRAEDGLAVHLLPEDLKGLFEVMITGWRDDGPGWRDDRHPWVGAPG